MAGINLKDLTLKELEQFIDSMGAEKYRARQVAKWIFQKGACFFQDMTDLPGDMRQSLEEEAWISVPQLILKQVSRRGDTVKYLFALSDGQAVESVLMRHVYGATACVSSQIGCRMGCRFCASGEKGLSRNLSAGEIYDQVLGMLRDTGERIGRVVLMGSGEPLDNYSHVLTFIRNVTANYGLHIGCRQITVSTCGLVPGINRLAAEGLPLTLAVSLHASNDRLRSELVPVNKKYPLKTLLTACRNYTRSTGRRVTFEYALLAGINDSVAAAEELGRLLSGMLGHVNLIPVNPVAGQGVAKPGRERVEKFKEIVAGYGLAVTVRREFGTDIDAACGQLKRRLIDKL